MQAIGANAHEHTRDLKGSCLPALPQVPTDVVTQLDFVALLAEKGLVSGVTSTVDELGLARVSAAGQLCV